MPFWTLLGYLFSSDYEWWESQSALLATDESTLGVLGHLGLIGITAFTSGVLSIRRRSLDPNPHRPLKIAIFAGLSGIVLASLHFYAPQATIFSTSYAEIGGGAAEAVNLFSLGLFANILLAFLYVDARFDPSSNIRLLKTVVCVVLLLITSIYYGLLRGDRDSLGLILVVVFMAINEFKLSLKAIFTRRMIIISTLLLFIIVSFTVLQTVRVKIADQQVGTFKEEFIEALKYNTWSAILLNNLGSAHEYLSKDFEYKFGQTYLDYILSLPPGFISNMVGYERPIEANKGPNWWFSGLSVGGMHPVIVPFHNFGVIGVIVILWLQGRLVGIADRLSLGGFIHLFWYSVFGVIAFRWFWYGDMNFIRGIMVGAILHSFYKLGGAFKR
jgi:hypothetical protein